LHPKPARKSWLGTVDASRLLALRDIADETFEYAMARLVVSNKQSSFPDPSKAAIPVAYSILDLEMPPASQRLLYRAPDLAAVVRVNEIAIGNAICGGERIGGISGQVGGAFADKQHGPVLRVQAAVAMPGRFPIKVESRRLVWVRSRNIVA
jgi:hypothetical protein